MSRENLDTVRGVFDAWGEGDFRASVGHFDPNVVLVVGREFPDAGISLGPEAVRDYTTRFMQQWDGLTMAAEEIRHSGDTVLVRTRQRGSGKASGVESEMTYFWIFSFRGGRIIRLESVRDEAQALKAAGLRERAMSRERVEVVRRGFEAWNTGDMDALRELYDPDIIWRAPEGWPEPGPYVGRDAVMRQLAQMRETWDADALELISDFIDIGDRVAVRLIWLGVGHGPESNMELTGVYTVRKGRLHHIEFFWDHAEALDALGVLD